MSRPEKFLYKHDTGPTHGEIWYVSTGRQVTAAEAVEWENKYIAQCMDQMPGDPLRVEIGHLDPLPPSREIRGFASE